jgi:methylated-DNA-[protein]-cysteine S-methyltransferase
MNPHTEASRAMLCTRVDSPVGPLRLAATAHALIAVEFETRKHPVPSSDHWREGTNAVLERAGAQLAEYFSGRREVFDLPLAPSGTPFQQRVWTALRTIPYGHTWSYVELAQRIGQPAASRAVGAANGRNPISIIVPCHRVIGADGSLTGFGGGVAVKQRLLELERAQQSLGLAERAAG